MTHPSDISSGLARLWAPWRSSYIETVATDPTELRPNAEGSLFERIQASDLPDDQTFIVARGEHCFTILNIYPYGSGHLLVLPKQAAPRLGELATEVVTELWSTVTFAVGVLERVYSPDGVNVGLNQGSAAGAGVPDHLHVHVVPRWAADANFMTTVAETRVLPEPLGQTWLKVTAEWTSN